MPYYVSVVAASAVEGQALVARSGQVAGWLVALTAPLLGVVVDRMGPRKPMLALTVLLMLPLHWVLWWVTPGGPIGPLVFLLLVAAGQLLFAWTEVFHNALLLPAAGRQAARASGLGLALGNLCSVLMLVIVLWAFSLPGSVDWGWVPKAPLFGVDPATYEPARLMGPVVAVSLAIGLAFILFGVPDVKPTGEKLGRALLKGFGDLKAMVGELQREKQATRFLIARMLFADGKTAILLFGGVLAAGTMGWETLEMLAYGIILSIMAVFGGLLAGWLDPRIGPRQALLLEIGATAIAFLGILLTSPTRIFGRPFDAVGRAPLWNGPMFTTWPEVAFIAIACVSAIAITAAYASSRTMITYLVRPDRTGSFFGLYALSGTATMWLGPMLVAWGTRATQSQQGGLATVLLLLAAGFAVLLTVDAPRRLPIWDARALLPGSRSE